MKTVTIEVKNESVTKVEIKIPSWWKFIDQVGSFKYFQVYEKKDKAVCDMVVVYSATSVLILTDTGLDAMPIMDCTPIEKEQYDNAFNDTIRIMQKDFELRNFAYLTSHLGEGGK